MEYLTMSRKKGLQVATTSYPSSLKMIIRQVDGVAVLEEFVKMVARRQVHKLVRSAIDQMPQLKMKDKLPTTAVQMVCKMERLPLNRQSLSPSIAVTQKNCSSCRLKTFAGE